MCNTNDVLKSARKFASSVKDEGISIIVNGLCSIIEELLKEIQLQKEEGKNLVPLLRKVFEDFILEGDYDEKVAWLAEVEQLLKKDK